ncbi:MAG: hypothetical protein K2Q01_08495 [Rickettsiales bacterium]|nr:hypothetical protein [Rickettsiales bacterium]
MPARPVTRIVSDTVVGTAEGAWAAVQMPFEDMNLKRRPIPDQLKHIADNPYIPPPRMLCESIRTEIAQLDALLGPDTCTPANPNGTEASRKGEYVDQGARLARDQAVGMVRGKADIMPFRGIVRRITGAEKHAKAVERAYEAGKLRRAFLKGFAASLGPACLNPIPPAPGLY